MEKRKKYRSVIFFGNYFHDFFVKQKEKVREKIVWTLELLEELPVIPEKYLKHIENTPGLFELRVQTGSEIFRIFCFFDKGSLVIIISGFQKKTRKTPKKEIEKALKIKQAYENSRK